MGHNHGASKIPVLPLVDILFSAFAAVLGTATVAMAMIRTNVPDADRPELPYFTIVASSSDAGCTKKLRPEFHIKLPGGKDDEVVFSDVALANGATTTAPARALVNAWYFQDSDPAKDEQLGKFCAVASGCVRAELVVLTAKTGKFTVKPAVAESACPNIRLTLLLGPLAKAVGTSDLVAPGEVRTITIEVQP